MQNQQLTVKQETVDLVATKIKEFQSSGEIALPPNYSPENALKSAWLKILATEDKEKKPALDTCTKETYTAREHYWIDFFQTQAY
jgi:recombination protein RecT